MELWDDFKRLTGIADPKEREWLTVVSVERTKVERTESSNPLRDIFDKVEKKALSHLGISENKRENATEYGNRLDNDKTEKPVADMSPAALKEAKEAGAPAAAKTINSKVEHASPLSALQPPAPQNRQAATQQQTGQMPR